MASEVYDAALEVRGAINRVADLIEGDPFPERIAVALEGILGELRVRNQLAAYFGLFERTDFNEIRAIINGSSII